MSANFLTVGQATVKLKSTAGLPGNQNRFIIKSEAISIGAWEDPLTKYPQDYYFPIDDDIVEDPAGKDVTLTIVIENSLTTDIHYITSTEVPLSTTFPATIQWYVDSMNTYRQTWNTKQGFPCNDRDGNVVYVLPGTTVYCYFKRYYGTQGNVVTGKLGAFSINNQNQTTYLTNLP